jgi:hypothetical protein
VIREFPLFGAAIGLQPDSGWITPVETARLAMRGGTSGQQKDERA